MSLEAFIAVKRLRGVSATERLLLYAMADYADRAGESVFPSVPTLAEELEVDERTVQRAIRSLEAAGLLERAGMSGRAPYQTIVYALPFVQGRQNVTPDPRIGVTVGVTPVSPDPEIQLEEDDLSLEGSTGSGGVSVTPSATSTVSRALWDAYTDMTMELHVPFWAEQQIEHWVTNGCTLEHVEAALRIVAAERPAKPWGYFKTVLGQQLLALKKPASKPVVTLTAEEVRALRERAR